MVVLTQPAIAHVLIKAFEGSRKVLCQEIQEEKNSSKLSLVSLEPEG